MSGFLAHLPTDPALYLVGLPTVFLIAMSKGAFGGGLAILGVPLLSFVMSPLDAAITVAPLVAFMDLFAIGSFGPKTWSRQDLAWILPALVAGIGLGYIFFTRVNPHLVAACIGGITVSYTSTNSSTRRRSSSSAFSPPGTTVTCVISAGMSSTETPAACIRSTTCWANASAG